MSPGSRGSPRGSEDSQSATGAILGAIHRLGSAALPRNPNLACTCLICLETLSSEEFEVRFCDAVHLSFKLKSRPPPPLPPKNPLPTQTSGFSFV